MEHKTLDLGRKMSNNVSQNATLNLQQPKTLTIHFKKVNPLYI